MKRVAALCAVLLLCACSRGEQGYYPLKEGSTWEYQISLGRGQTERGVLTNLAQRDLKGKKVTPQKFDIGQQSYFTFIAADDTGIYEYAQQPAGALEPEVPSVPSFLFKYPLKTGNTWDGTTEPKFLSAKISIPITADNLVEFNEEFLVSLSNPQGAAKKGTAENPTKV